MADVALEVKIFNGDEAGRFLAMASIGLLSSVRAGVIELDEAERLLFSPGASSVFRKKGISVVVCDLVMECCELEDILGLLPDRFDSELVRLIDAFSEYLAATTPLDAYSDHTEYR
ncbi:DUF3969 family protein [Pseudomonas sp. B21-023]|uniref:DUF3969 family protein n=1 Tax=Pseudomonas sp. B21-023 TaxID=2895477 RepID=UPI00215FA9C1|nr:DUF3969 family protein [Pseudomonas sp. B21-023]UVM15213.1 DUF3969 family protein [Pseudomonas sp. B21-023]